MAVADPRPVPLPHLLVLPRAVWLVLGVAAGAAAALLASPWLLLLWLVPDLGFLGGMRGYNALHVLAGPALLAAAGVVLGPLVLALAALWLCHIAIDRALGYLPRHG